MKGRVLAADLLGFGERRAPVRPTPDQRQELERCRQSFRHFLRYWSFIDRERGGVMTFAELWPGQEQFANLMEEHPWIFALKAGKLGFTELACAYDGWVARFRQSNARVHLFSRDAMAAQDLVGYVRFGLDRLPAWMRLPILREVAGGDTLTSVKLGAGPADIRTIVSYAAGPNVSIDQSATHSHVDELSHMLHPDHTWSAIETTIAPGGSCHIVTRGAGDNNYTAELWRLAEAGVARLTPFFAPWSARPDRDAGWREGHAGNLANQALLHFAPETPDDALAGDETAEYIPLPIWDQCHDQTLPELQPGDGTALVLGVDASVTGDMFGVVAVSRHPERPNDPAIRACRAWSPADHGGRINFDVVEDWLRRLCEGGCFSGHPPSRPQAGCEDCAFQRLQPRFNVVQICYDPYQLEAMMQRLQRESIAWCRAFSQGPDRAKADASLLRLALQRRLAHNGDELLREHIGNARAKLSKDDDSQLRIVKKAPGRKVDLAVAASMAVSEVLRLNL